MGFKEIDFDIEDPKNRINISSDDSPFIISFDLANASDYKEDAYTWCYVDIFIKDSDIDVPDELKRLFTRFIDHEYRRILWRHRLLLRIIDMDKAVDYLMKVIESLREQMEEHGLI